MSLVGGGPFTVPPADPGYTYENIIISFTDGLNTEYRWYTSQSSIDARQTMTCDNIKSARMVPVSPLLQNCASDSSKFFYLTSSQVVTTFNQIGTTLSNLCISK